MKNNDDAVHDDDDDGIIPEANMPSETYQPDEDADNFEEAEKEEHV